MPRIELITSKDQIETDRYEEFDAITEILGRVGGPFGVLMHSPGLAEKVCRAGAQVRLGSSITMAERLLALLSTAREKDAAYEWSTHARHAVEHGVSEAALEAIRDNGDVADLDEDERDIIDFTRQLLRTNRVEQDLFDVLVKRHDVRWLVEITGTIGQYQYIAAINNAFGLEPRPDGPVLPIPAPSGG